MAMRGMQQDIYIYIYIYISPLLLMLSFGKCAIALSVVPALPVHWYGSQRIAMHASAQYLCSHSGMQDVSSRYKK